VNMAYIIFALDITDPSLMRDYVKAARDAIPPEVRVLAVNAPEVLEGTWYGQQAVLMEFENVDAARQWYRSSSYQAAAELRHAAARGKVAIVEGIDVQAFTDSTPESVADLIGDRF
jgi:uncharacterized protein (DUF1330 family)